MKRLILSMVLALAAGVALAQTDFRHISYAEGLKAAKAEGKLLFVDFYTEWCGPCKMMANNVFPQKDVGDYMNAKFVCLKIDAEKGEGVELAKRYAVKAYPTFVIIGADEKEVGRKVGGGSAADFMAAIERIVDPEKTPERLRERYAGGERKAELVEAYAALLKSEAYNDRRNGEAKLAEIDALVQDYYAGLSDAERLKEENLFIYMDYTHSASEASARFMVAHRDEFPAAAKERVAARIKELYAMDVLAYFSGERAYDAAAFRTLKEDIVRLGLDEDGEYGLAFRFVEKHAEGNLGAYLSFCEKEYGKLSASFQSTLMISLPKLVDTDDVEVLERANRFVRSRLEDMPVNEIYFASMTIRALEERMNAE